MMCYKMIKGIILKDLKIKQTNYFRKIYLLIEEKKCLRGKNTESIWLFKINNKILIIQMDFFSFIPYVDKKKE